MKKQIADLQGKSIEELNKEVSSMRSEIAKMKVEAKVKPQKDTNSIKKKEKHLARILTVIAQKQLGISK